MEPIDNTDLSIQDILSRDVELREELEHKKSIIKRNLSITDGREVLLDETPALHIKSITPTDRGEESIVLGELRPVLIIRNNRIVPEFSGPESVVWKNRLMEKRKLLDSVIPSVGRIEVAGNAIYKWAGTGWLVEKDIIVTNRHVAEVFCNNKEDFTFRMGYPDGLQSSNIDFLEEDRRKSSLEFDLAEVLWMSENENGQPDIAFMRVKEKPLGAKLPPPLKLAAKVSEGEVVVTIGYPARDPGIPDQDLVLKIFGNVYDKKRLAPGEVSAVKDHEIEHDCSTLGGNSGSPVISLATGEVVGLHFAGQYKKKNHAVSAPKIRDLLSELRAATLPRMRRAEQEIQNCNNANTNSIQNISPMGTYTFDITIPLKITVEVGTPNSDGTSRTADGPQTENYGLAVSRAKEHFKDFPGVLGIDKGFRFRRGWITDERVIVVEVDEKKSFPQLKQSGRELLPQEFMGYGIDVRTAGLTEQIAALGIDLSSLRELPKPGIYRRPPDLEFLRVKAHMKAVFHVSPDSGWPNLEKFFSRIEHSLTATIYEWEAPHISDGLYSAISKEERSLKMVTQKTGTLEAVTQLIERLGERFRHTWASVGRGRIVPSAYHIKVASRDDREFWLSSGNWKDSNQADIDPAGQNSEDMRPLLKKNREWHAIIENAELATMFRKYIEWDFDEANRVPLDEGVASDDVYILIPEEINSDKEALVKARYFDPLLIDRELDVEAILTPDRNDKNQSIFLEKAINLIASAKKTIDIENQSFNLLDENEPEFERFFTALLRLQQKGIAIRIIFRDPMEFGFAKGTASLQKLLDRIKEFGLNTHNIKVQRACHTKAIIIDSHDPENACVLFGSHNLTTSGTMYNRDASLLVKDAEVARYFQGIFNYDWEYLAQQNAEESNANLRLATSETAIPEGYRKVSVLEMLGLV